MSTKTKTHYQRFTGRNNSGVRAKIRSVTDGASCGAANAARVLRLAERIAFTGRGQAILSAVAEDYRTSGPKHNPRCDCYACYAGTLQRLGASG
jgi:hypothetical protein